MKIFGMLFGKWKNFCIFSFSEMTYKHWLSKFSASIFPSLTITILKEIHITVLFGKIMNLKVCDSRIKLSGWLRARRPEISSRQVISSSPPARDQLGSTENLSRNKRAQRVKPHNYQDVIYFSSPLNIQA